MFRAKALHQELVAKELVAKELVAKELVDEGPLLEM